NSPANVWKVPTPSYRSTMPTDQGTVDIAQSVFIPKSLSGPTSLSSFDLRAQRVAKFLDSQLVAQVGSQTSQGDLTHRAADLRNWIGPDGTGIKIGIISNGVTNLASSQALGDLGPVTVLPGQTGSGDEGTAMLEIVHDLAPGAQL